MEMLIALALAAVVTLAAWPCCWSLSSVSRRQSDHERLASDLAFAGGLFTREVRACAGVSTAAGSCGPAAITLLTSDEATGVAGSIVYRYDGGRHILWRGSAATYVLEGASSCRFAYYDDGGRELLSGPDGCLSAEAASMVRRVRLEVAVVHGDITVGGRWDAAVRTR